MVQVKVTGFYSECRAQAEAIVLFLLVLMLLCLGEQFTCQIGSTIEAHISFLLPL